MSSDGQNRSASACGVSAKRSLAASACRDLAGDLKRSSVGGIKVGEQPVLGSQWRRRSEVDVYAMAAMAECTRSSSYDDTESVSRELSENSRPRILIIGAGSRGQAYARAIRQNGDAVVVAVAEPMVEKRTAILQQHIWPGQTSPWPGHVFGDWRAFVDHAKLHPGFVDAAFICTPDATHAEIVEALAPLGLHIMCEKPLATSLADCLRIRRALLNAGGNERAAGIEEIRSVSLGDDQGSNPSRLKPAVVFAIGHVLRYSPHNILLRRVLVEDRAIGDVLSMEHTEPVGYWHFAHSYIRGQWRREDMSAPSLLTKSCHDIDLILWLLGSSSTRASFDVSGAGSLSMPSRITSVGHLTYFKRSRKPAAAGRATNCLSCALVDTCIYSAKRIYLDHHLRDRQDRGWPVKIVVPDIEDLWQRGGPDLASKHLRDALAEDYGPETPVKDIRQRSWYGRCVYESDNDVCDDQMVTLSWDENSRNNSTEGFGSDLNGKGNGDAIEDTKTNASIHPSFAKTASSHMVAFTEKQCERRGRLYGTNGEIEYDSNTIKVHTFSTRETTTHKPRQEGGGHGGGDFGLARQFIKAVQAVRSGAETVAEAQSRHIGATLDDMLHGHALVFAAEDARRQQRVVQWDEWWRDHQDGF